MKFDAVIFDLDGTHVDTLEDLADAMNRVWSGEEAPVHSYATYKLLIGKGSGTWSARRSPPRSAPPRRSPGATSA